MVQPPEDSVKHGQELWQATMTDICVYMYEGIEKWLPLKLSLIALKERN